MDFRDILSNKVLLCAVSCWFFAQVLKVLLHAVIEKEFKFERLHGSGGMPSSHASTVVGLCTATGLHDGFDSTLFAISFILAVIVMHDASRVRKSVGEHAKLLNELFEDIIKNGINNKGFKELVGHKPIEVFVGGLLGLLISSIIYYMV